MTRTTTQEQLWQQMQTLAKPDVAVSRVTTRPRATTRPPPIQPDPSPDAQFDGSE